MSDTKSEVIRLSNGEKVDLIDLSVEELRRLYYEEERWTAENLLKLEPFSRERMELLYKGHEFITPVAYEIARKQGQTKTSFGADTRSVNMLVKLINEKLKQSNHVAFYEIGVGTGYAITEVLSRCGSEPQSMGRAKGLSIKGCDMFLLPSIMHITELFPDADVELTEGHVYDCIQMLPDNSIDVLYADNVFEHFFPDEAERIYSEIKKKLKTDACVFILIPNRYRGPHDISKYFLPAGAKAQGFHFMEMSFNEITEAMGKYGIEHSCCVVTITNNRFLRIKNKLILKIKLRMEPFRARIPIKIVRNLVFGFWGYSVSLMRKAR
jgi:SAM-dependent methyltransferase